MLLLSAPALEMSEPSEKGSAMFTVGLGNSDFLMSDLLGGDADTEEEQGKQPKEEEEEEGTKQKKLKKVSVGKFRKGQLTKSCRVCHQELTKESFTGTKAECKECFPHWEAARRDAIKQQELDFFNQINDDEDLLAEFMADWKATTPPSEGPGKKRGGYKFANFRKRVGKRSGLRRTRRKVMKTKKAFCDKMVARGRPLPWAEKEYNRRMNGETEWKTGVCRDTQLPTVQCCASSEEEEFSEDYAEDEVEASTKNQAANKRNISELLEGLGEGNSREDLARALKTGGLVSLLPEFAERKNDDDTGGLMPLSSASFLAKRAKTDGSAASTASTTASSGGTIGASPAKDHQVEVQPLYEDLFTALISARDKQLQAVETLQLQTDEMVNDMREALLEGQELEKKDFAVFGNRVKALKVRLDCLMVVACNSSEEPVAHKKDMEASIVNKPESEIALLYPIPRVVFGALLTLRELRLKAQNLGNECATSAEVTTEINKFAELLKAPHTLLVACRSAMKGLSSAKSTREAFERSKEQRIVKQENAQKAREAAAAKAAAGKRTGKKPADASLIAVFDLDLTVATTLKPVRMEDVKPETAESFSVPYIVKKAALIDEIADRPGVKINSMVLKGGVIKGTKPRDVRVLSRIGDIRSEILSIFGPPQTTMESNSDLKQTFIWAAKKGTESCSIEFGCVDTLVVSTASTTSVSYLVLNMFDFRVFYMHILKNENAPTLVDVKNFFKDVTQERFEDMTARITVWSTALHHSVMLFIPAGSIVLEKHVGAFNMGLKFHCVHMCGSPKPAFGVADCTKLVEGKSVDGPGGPALVIMRGARDALLAEPADRQVQYDNSWKSDYQPFFSSVAGLADAKGQEEAEEAEARKEDEEEKEERGPEEEEEEKSEKQKDEENKKAAEAEAGAEEAPKENKEPEVQKQQKEEAQKGDEEKKAAAEEVHVTEEEQPKAQAEGHQEGGKGEVQAESQGKAKEEAKDSETAPAEEEKEGAEDAEKKGNEAEAKKKKAEEEAQNKKEEAQKKKEEAAAKQAAKKGSGAGPSTILAALAKTRARK